ncbi:hypothetical protein Tco_0567642 [Tanacetum coccineum]
MNDLKDKGGILQKITGSTQVSTANLSYATVYAFLANQPNRSQLVHEDLEQIHEDDLEEIDLKWQLALLSMRTRKFFQKTNRKITINESDTAGYDKSKLYVDEEVPTYMAVMSFSDSETCKSVSEDTSNEVRESPDASLVEELVSNDKLEKKTHFPIVAKINFVRPQQQEKPVRKPVKYAEMYREREVFGNNYTRVNYNYSDKKAHLSAHKNIVPRAVLMKTGLRPLNTARPVNTTHPKTIGHPQKEDQGYVNSGCSRHMTSNMSYLSDFKKFNGGYFTLGGGAKRGRITGTKESIGAGHSSKEPGSSQDYILMPLWKDERFSSTEPTDDKERTLWVELKRLFEPNTDDTLWKLQRYMHDPLKWRLYDTRGVHHVSTERGIDIFMLVEKEYPLSKGVMTLMLVNKLLVEQYSEMANELLRKIFIQENIPRQ